MKIKDGFILEKVGNSYLAVAVGERAAVFSGLVRMNESGAFFWNLIKDKDMSKEEVLAAAIAEYDAPEDVLLADISSFEEKLRAAGIIE